MEILDVDLLAFETGSAEERRSVVDGVLRSLATGFVYVEHDLSVDLIDEAVARTIRTGGRCVTVGREEMPGGVAVAAVRRY